MTQPIVRDGTSQQSRVTPALEEGFIHVDEMEFEDLLAMSANYARTLVYYDSLNERSGDWEQFFTCDEAVIMSLILTTRFGNIESEFFNQIDRNISQFGPDYELRKVPSYQLAKEIDFWFDRLQTAEGVVGRNLEKRITELIDGQLRDELHSLERFFGQFGVDIGKNFTQVFSGIWRDSLGEPSSPVPSQTADRIRIERFLRLNFHSFQNALSSLKSSSRNFLPVSLESKTHPPATGLYIAFAKLFQKAQQRANQFTRKHLEFYYEDILKVQPRRFLADSAYLILYPDTADREIPIKKGREFTAGTDENNQYVIYTADTDLLVNGAQVRSLRTLHFQRDRFKSPENRLEFFSGAKANQIPVLPESGPVDDEELKAWPLFGAPKPDSQVRIFDNAEIGFAIASPVLFLSEGERHIDIGFKFKYQGSSLFGVSDLIDLTGIVTKLRLASDPLSKFLLEQISPVTRELAEEFDEANPPTDSLRSVLVDELNKVLEGEPLFDEARFVGVTLRNNVRNLISQDPQGEQLIYLNRMLLEDAFPDEIAKSPYLDYWLGRLGENNGEGGNIGESQYLEYFLAQLAGLLDSTPQYAFFKAFRQMFAISLTAENGWFEVPDYLPLVRTVDDKVEKDSLTIRIPLSPDVDPIVAYSPEVHGGDYDSELPLVRFIINPAAHLYPYSLLKNIVISEIEINVDVRGVREILLYNNLGQLDTTNPFNPFGPIPSVGSYMVIGNSETARKRITRFDVDIQWGDLPSQGLGFSDYYRAYGMPFSASLFEASVTVLRDGRWVPNEEHEQSAVKLFESEDSDGESGGWNSIRTNRLSLGENVTRYFKPMDTIPADDEFGYSSLARNGFFKFTLTRPEYAFGHRDYPLKLTNVLTINSRLKKPRLLQPVPNPPYTPVINRISINYEASWSINLGQITSLDISPLKEGLFHIHPFGLENLLQARHRYISMVPQYDKAGNLFIGISAPRVPGMLTLFFHLREDSTPEAGAVPAGLTWYYLSSNQWKPLEISRVISDTTNGFLSSGIVTLNLPQDISRDNTVLPGDLYWLRVSADHHEEALCSVYRVYAQALKVTRQVREDSQTGLERSLPAGRIQEPRISIPGIGGLNQIVDSFGGSPPESAAQLKTRISERLRHKNRALVPWDYERLILERFPDIWKVKCLANSIAEPGQEHRVHPGHISIVVIPDTTDRPTMNLKPIVNGLVLRDIKEFAKSLASPFTTIAVRNPAYEQIQVRCAVTFNQRRGEGSHIRALNQAITDYISPWNRTVGCRAEFGWSIRRFDVESYIRSLEFVEYVTDFSMLRISETGEDYFRLFDTVKPETQEDEISASFPWSIAIPMRRHAIEARDEIEPIQPNITGINELEIGSTFIISEK